MYFKSNHIECLTFIPSCVWQDKSEAPLPILEFPAENLVNWFYLMIQNGMTKMTKYGRVRFSWGQFRRSLLGQNHRHRQRPFLQMEVSLSAPWSPTMKHPLVVALFKPPTSKPSKQVAVISAYLFLACLPSSLQPFLPFLRSWLIRKSHLRWSQILAHSAGLVGSKWPTRWNSQWSKEAWQQLETHEATLNKTCEIHWSSILNFTTEIMINWEYLCFKFVTVFFEVTRVVSDIQNGRRVSVGFFSHPRTGQLPTLFSWWNWGQLPLPRPCHLWELWKHILEGRTCQWRRSQKPEPQGTWLGWFYRFHR